MLSKRQINVGNLKKSYSALKKQSLHPQKYNFKKVCVLHILCGCEEVWSNNCENVYFGMLQVCLFTTTSVIELNQILQTSLNVHTC